MTKTCKKSLITVFLTLCFAMLLCFFAACGPNDGNEGEDGDTVTYSVTVKTDETAFASGVRVTVRKGGVSFDPVSTDENGKAEFELVPDDYTVTLSNLPTHYSVPADADLSLTGTKHDLTVTLAEDFSYKVYLVNPDGTPYYAQNVYVGICTLSGNCLQPQPLEAGGIARCEGDLTDYEVQITGLPDSVTFEHGEGTHANYYTGAQFSATETEMTITIYPVPVVNEITDTAPMTNAEKSAYAAKNSLYSADSALTAYHFEKTLAAGETAYYSVTPSISGDYKIYKDGNASYLRSDALQLGNKGYGIYSFITLQAGSKYYINVTNTGSEAITAEFVLELPSASYTKITAAGTVDVTVSNVNANAVIELAPVSGASFKLTALGSASVSILQCDTASLAERAEHDDNSFKTNAELSVKFTEDNVGGSLFISVAVKEAANFQIKVEKIADLKNTTTVLESNETLVQFGDVSKTLAALPYGSTLYYDNENGIYHLNDENGPVIVVMLTKKSDRFSLNGGLVYLEEFNERLVGNPYIVDVTSDADKADMTKGNAYSDYRTMLRGFGDYNFEPNMQGGFNYVRPAASGNYYAKFVNSDGVYPLTKELETFLKAVAANYASNIIGATEGNAWQFACYYYSDEDPDPVEKDIIVGTYEQFSMASGTTVLTVNADGTFVISETMGSSNGTWVKNSDGTYTFTENTENWGEVPYEVTRDSQSGKLTFMDGEDVAYEFELPAADPVVGEYVQESRGGNINLTVNADGTFVISETMGNTNGTWIKNGDGTYAFNSDWSDYTVTRDATTGGLKFHSDDESDPDWFEYEFEAVE